METQSYIPSITLLSAYGLSYKLEKVTSKNGGTYTGVINAPNDVAATRMLCKWIGSGLVQVAHKEAGEGPEKWKFKGFGQFADEAHFLRLLDVQLQDGLADFLNNT